jgi:glutaredoxin
VTPLLLGMKESASSNKAERLLSDAGIRFRYQDILTKDSRVAEMMQAISGSYEVPQLFVGGDSYVGIEQIRRYIGS